MYTNEYILTLSLLVSGKGSSALLTMERVCTLGLLESLEESLEAEVLPLSLFDLEFCEANVLLF
jgi:hypothetical protein